MTENSNWRHLISMEMEEQGEDWKDVVSCTLTEPELDVEFYPGYGGTDGQPFTLWTTRRVYFPCCYDGAEWVSSVPRNPNGEVTEHIGGG